MDKLHKGYFDIAGNKIPLMVVQSKSDGVNQRIGMLAKFPRLSYFFRFFGELPDYLYFYVQLEVPEHGVGKGSLSPKMRLTFNAQGQMTLATRASEAFEVTLVRAVK